MPVFVLHPDLDVLVAIVGKLRDRGLDELHAAEAAPLVARGSKERPSALVLPERSDGVEHAAQLAALRAAFPDVPEILIPPLRSADDPAIGKLVDAVTSALAAAAPIDAPLPAGTGEVRGDLAQIPLPDLLQLLSMGKKTGMLTVTTSTSAGELRLENGEVVDAVFRRADGMKAVIRLLGERDGAFHFAPDFAPTLRRIREPISTILMEGTRQTDEIRRLREQLGLVAPNQVLTLHVLDVQSALDPGDAIAKEVARSLGSPRTLEDLVDDLPHHDLDILKALARLDAAKALRRLPIGDLRPSLAGPEGMVVLRGLARRLRPRGYRGPGRLVFVGSAGSVRLARQAIARLAEAMPGADSGSELSGDRVIESTATLQLGDGIALEIVTLIDRADVTAMLPMVLNGAIGVVTLERPSPTLGQIVEELEVALVDARSVADDLPFDVLEPGDPQAIAAVVRGAIEGMGGT
jgi:hypothetical protein